jgi:hypothetical protein
MDSWTTTLAASLMAEQLYFIYANHLHIRYLTVRLGFVNPIEAPEGGRSPAAKSRSSWLADTRRVRLADKSGETPD